MLQVEVFLGHARRMITGGAGLNKSDIRLAALESAVATYWKNKAEFMKVPVARHYEKRQLVSNISADQLDGLS